MHYPYKKKNFSNSSLLHIIGIIVNGYTCSRKSVILPNTRLSNLIIKLLLRNNFITSYRFSTFNTIKDYNKIFVEIYLSYFENQVAISSMQSVSLPSRRRYITFDILQKFIIKNKQSIPILSTNIGLLTGNEALQAHVGGELICLIN